MNISIKFRSWGMIMIGYNEKYEGINMVLTYFLYFCHVLFLT